MHTAALAAGLALSLVERKVKKRVVNYWEPFQDLYKQLKTAIKYVFDKKNKRFKDYNDVIRKSGKLVIVVSLPNSTRVAGALILLQDSIRSLHSLCYYALKCEKFEALCLNRIQWKQLTQFEAVMNPAMRLCFDSQGDRPEIAGEMPLTVIHLKVGYQYQEVYDVVDVDFVSEWVANIPFYQLPTIKMTTNPEKATKENIP